MQTRILLPTHENLRQAAELIKRGEIVAFPTETVYGLGADGLQCRGVSKNFREEEFICKQKFYCRQVKICGKRQN